MAKVIQMGGVEDRLEQEAWMHAACLSIAEGCPQWDQPAEQFWMFSPAMGAVQKLRRERDALLEACKKANTCASLPDAVKGVIRETLTSVQPWRVEEQDAEPFDGLG